MWANAFRVLLDDGSFPTAAAAAFDAGSSLFFCGSIFLVVSSHSPCCCCCCCIQESKCELMRCSNTFDRQLGHKTKRFFLRLELDSNKHSKAFLFFPDMMQVLAFQEYQSCVSVGRVADMHGKLLKLLTYLLFSPVVDLLIGVACMHLSHRGTSGKSAHSDTRFSIIGLFTLLV